MSKFVIGKVVATPGAIKAIEESGQFAAEFVIRHSNGDWGSIDSDDIGLNEEAIKNGARVMSVYKTTNGTVIWVITEAENDFGHREVTTILLPDDY